MGWGIKVAVHHNLRFQALCACYMLRSAYQVTTLWLQPWQTFDSMLSQENQACTNLRSNGLMLDHQLRSGESNQKKAAKIDNKILSGRLIYKN
jgi:hypothetical protein